MTNNVMQEIRVVMGTWYVNFCIDSPATAPEMARCRESNLDLREPPRQRRQKSFLLRLELALVFPEEEGMMQQSSVSISLSF